MTLATETKERPVSDFAAALDKAPRFGLVHVCGFPSSGTDLLSNFISSHPDIHVRGEFPMLPRLAKRFGPLVPRAEVPEVIEALRTGDVYANFENRSPTSFESDPRPFVPLADIYAAMLTTRNVRWCGNKTPQNTENMDRLLKLFPDTRFILITRDIRDVCVSWREKWGKNVHLCAARWNARMQRGLNIAASLPEGRVLLLRFEDLLANPGGTGAKVCTFLNLEFSENFNNYHEFVTRNPDGKKNFGRPIKAENHDKWRKFLSPDEVRRVEEIAFPMMERFGYPAELATGHRPMNAFERLYGAAMDTGSAFLVGNRYRKKNRLRDRLRRIGISIRYRMPGA